MCHMSSVTCHVSLVTCHVSCFMCHMSHVTCHMYFLFFFGQSGEAYRWRVCYQRGQPRLVLYEVAAGTLLAWPSVGGFCRSCVAFGLLQPLQIPLVPSQEPGQAPHLTLQHITALQCNALNYTALHRTAMQSTDCTAPHSTVLHCTAQYSALHSIFCQIG